ncbi:hypothetical protein HDU97_009408 [Phlyctochytrium planicorne]|nr:hypothetical protein HDU97_009408 [Phlyctochytrium planicorne]
MSGQVQDNLLQDSLVFGVRAISKEYSRKGIYNFKSTFPWFLTTKSLQRLLEIETDFDSLVDQFCALVKAVHENDKPEFGESEDGRFNCQLLAELADCLPDYARFLLAEAFVQKWWSHSMALQILSKILPSTMGNEDDGILMRAEERFIHCKRRFRWKAVFKEILATHPCFNDKFRKLGNFIAACIHMDVKAATEAFKLLPTLPRSEQPFYKSEDLTLANLNNAICSLQHLDIDLPSLIAWFIPACKQGMLWHGEVFVASLAAARSNDEYIKSSEIQEKVLEQIEALWLKIHKSHLGQRKPLPFPSESIEMLLAVWVLSQYNSRCPNAYRVIQSLLAFRHFDPSSINQHLLKASGGYYLSYCQRLLLRDPRFDPLKYFLESKESWFYFPTFYSHSVRRFTPPGLAILSKSDSIVNYITVRDFEHISTESFKEMWARLSRSEKSYDIADVVASRNILDALDLVATSPYFKTDILKRMTRYPLGEDAVEKLIECVNGDADEDFRLLLRTKVAFAGALQVFSAFLLNLLRHEHRKKRLFRLCVYLGCHRMVKHLLKQYSLEWNVSKDITLLIACSRCDVEMVKILMEDGEFKADWTRQRHLIAACSGIDHLSALETVRYLMQDERADPSNQQKRALHEACLQRNLPLIKLLIEHKSLRGFYYGSPFNGYFLGDHEVTALLASKIEFGYHDTFETLVEEGHIDLVKQALRQTNLYLYLPRILAVIYQVIFKIKDKATSCSMLRLFLSDPTLDPRRHPASALRFAVWHGRLDFVEILMEDGRMDPSVREHEVIWMAMKRGHMEILEVLKGDPRVDLKVVGEYAREYLGLN